jgi:phosphonoacetaldehyde hydrolase
MRIKAILFDLIGTTVIEKDPLLINHCLEKAFKDHKIPVNMDLITANRGKDKYEMIKIILEQSGHSLQLCESILTSFITELENNLHNFSENEGIRETIRNMKQKQIKTGVGTGLPRDIFEKIYRYLHWQSIPFDYIGIANETGRGRPYPDMILDMMNKYKINHFEFLKVGDTVADIQEGKNAKVWTAVILSGTQDESELINQNPDFTIRSLAELNKIIE